MNRSRYRARIRSRYSAVAAASASFNPWSASYPTPINGVWMDDPAWTNPGDGNVIVSLRNQSGNGDPAADVGSVIFRASVASFNNHAAIQFDGASALDVDTPNFAQPYTWVTVFITSVTDGNLRYLGAGHTAANRGIGQNNTGSGVWVINAGTTLASATVPDTNPHIRTDVFNGASSEIFLDQTSVAAGTASTDGWQRFILGSGSADGITHTNFMTGYIAFAAAYAVSSRTAGIISLENDLMTYYGL